jgi:hypothetical protein
MVCGEAEGRIGFDALPSPPKLAATWERGRPSNLDSILLLAFADEI